MHILWPKCRHCKFDPKKCKFYDSHENITSSTTLHSAIFQPKNINKKLSKLFNELYKQGNNVAPQVLSTRLFKKKHKKPFYKVCFEHKQKKFKSQTKTTKICNNVVMQTSRARFFKKMHTKNKNKHWFLLTFKFLDYNILLQSFHL
jgi:hypothetical protein